MLRVLTWSKKIKKNKFMKNARIYRIDQPCRLRSSLWCSQDNWEYIINLNDNDYPITSNQALLAVPWKKWIFVESVSKVVDLMILLNRVNAQAVCTYGNESCLAYPKQPNSMFEWMFDGTSIFHVMIWSHPTETGWWDGLLPFLKLEPPSFCDDQQGVSFFWLHVPCET